MTRLVATGVRTAALSAGIALFTGCSSSDHAPIATDAAAAGSPGTTAGTGGATSSGGTSSGGTPSGGTSSGGANPAAGGVTATGGSAGGTPRPVTACRDLPNSGTWQNTTPAEVSARFAQQQFGVIALAVNPADPATVYFGTHQIGIWKSTDCGATFAHIDTGENGSVIDGGFQWTLSIDPTDPKVLYTNSGYSSSSGAWKSTNGGVDWHELWPPADPTLKNVVDYNFVHKVRIDPHDHQHLLISFHAACKAPYNSACIAESHDAGTTWKLVNGDPSWTGGEDQTVWFLTDSDRWLYASQSNGLWRTSNAGGTWTSINASWGGHNGGQLYRATDGTFYLAAPAGILRSPDGVSWSRIDGVGTGLIGITGDGTSLFASHGPYAQTPTYLPYVTSPEKDGRTWTTLESPSLSTGGYELAFDPDHHLLYSTSGTAGFWRATLP